jgi:hypothetical protein
MRQQRPSATSMWLQPPAALPFQAKKTRLYASYSLLHPQILNVSSNCSLVILYSIEGANLFVPQSRRSPVVLRSPLIFMAITTQVVRDAATCGALSCVVLRLDCDARNMVLLTTGTGEARAVKRGRRSEKAFEIPGRRPQKTVVFSMAIRVKGISHRFSIFYLRE